MCALTLCFYIAPIFHVQLYPFEKKFKPNMFHRILHRTENFNQYFNFHQLLFIQPITLKSDNSKIKFEKSKKSVSCPLGGGFSNSDIQTLRHCRNLLCLRLDNLLVQLFISRVERVISC